MKKYLVLLLIIISNSLFAQQMKLTIEKIWINGVERDYKNGEIKVHNLTPSLKIKCRLINSLGENQKIKPFSASYYIEYSFKDSIYRKEVFPLGFMDNENINLKPGESTEFTINDNFIEGTGIIEEVKSNYSMELLEILPTIKVIYKERDFYVYSSQIKSVSIVKNN